jgi:hypothetical protein
VTKTCLAAFFAAGGLAAQTLVVDRPLAEPLSRQAIERPGHGFTGDFFRIGASGEVWMIETIRLWAIPARGPACGRELGDSIEKITLLGALDNPPVPGQPVCDCHALIELATVPLQKGASASGNPSVRLSRSGGAWQLDFQNVRWSVPGGTDVLFTLRATPRVANACHADTEWSLAAAPAPEGYRLHLLDAKGVPVGLAEPAHQPRSLNVQVWARQTK